MKIGKEVRIGIFAVAILALLYWGINFLKGRDLFNRNFTYYAYYDNVSGIQVSSPIIIKGINVGRVSDIKFRPEMNNSIQVTFDIKSTYRIPDNSVVRLFTNGIMGGKALEIELGDSSNFLPDGATIRSESETDFLELAGSELDYFKQKLNQLISSLDTTLASVSNLVSDNSDNIAGIIANLNQTIAAFGSHRDDIEHVIANINGMTSALAANTGKIDSTLINFQNISKELSEADLKETVNNLDAAIGELNKLLASANSENGTVGMLFNDPQLYDSLTVATSRLASLLEDLQNNPKRYVHFSLFGRK